MMYFLIISSEITFRPLTSYNLLKEHNTYSNLGVVRTPKLKWYSKSNYFVFNGQHYLQTRRL